MIPDDWEDEDTDIHTFAAAKLREALLKELDAISEDVKKRDPRRE